MNKLTNKFLALTVCLALMLSVVIPAFAAGSISGIPIKGTPAPNVKVFINNRQCVFNPPPIRYKGALYLPVEQFAKYIGGKVKYLKGKAVISAPGFSTTVTLYKDKKTGHTLFKVRSASLAVRWDGKKNILSISCPVKNYTKNSTQNSAKNSGTTIANKSNSSTSNINANKNSSVIIANPIIVSNHSDDRDKSYDSTTTDNNGNNTGKNNDTTRVYPGNDLSAPDPIIVPEQPIIEQPTPEQPIVEQPIPEQPIADQPNLEYPSIEQSIPEQPVIDQSNAQQSDQRVLTLKYVAPSDTGILNATPDDEGYLNIVIDDEVFKYTKPTKLVFNVEFNKFINTKYISVEPIATVDITNYKSGDIIRVPASYGDTTYEIFLTDYYSETNNRIVFAGSCHYKVNVTGAEKFKFLLPTIYTDSDNPEIIKTAREITEGKTTEREKVKAIYDFVREHVSYDPSYIGDRNRPASLVLQTGKAVCEGYSLLFSALCRAAGIPCQNITATVHVNDLLMGYVSVDHMWNKVYVDGKWYFVDVTQDDTDSPNFWYDHFLIDTLYDISVDSIPNSIE